MQPPPHISLVIVAPPPLRGREGGWGVPRTAPEGHPGAFSTNASMTILSPALSKPIESLLSSTARTVP
jgi:hypothetical protein